MLMYLYVVWCINISLKNKRKKKIENSKARFIVFKHLRRIYKMGLRSNWKFLQNKMSGT